MGRFFDYVQHGIGRHDTAVPVVANRPQGGSIQPGLAVGVCPQHGHGICGPQTAAIDISQGLRRDAAFLAAVAIACMGGPCPFVFHGLCAGFFYACHQVFFFLALGSQVLIQPLDGRPVGKANATFHDRG